MSRPKLAQCNKEWWYADEHLRRKFNEGYVLLGQHDIGERFSIRDKIARRSWRIVGWRVAGWLVACSCKFWLLKTFSFDLHDKLLLPLHFCFVLVKEKPHTWKTRLIAKRRPNVVALTYESSALQWVIEWSKDHHLNHILRVMIWSWSVLKKWLKVHDHTHTYKYTYK